MQGSVPGAARLKNPAVGKQQRGGRYLGQEKKSKPFGLNKKKKTRVVEEKLAPAPSILNGGGSNMMWGDFS